MAPRCSSTTRPSPRCRHRFMKLKVPYSSASRRSWQRLRTVLQRRRRRLQRGRGQATASISSATSSPERSLALLKSLQLVSSPLLSHTPPLKRLPKSRRLEPGDASSPADHAKYTSVKVDWKIWEDKEGMGWQE